MDFPEIPGYEILEALPRGGMSAVFKACQLSLNRIVALKTLPGNLARAAGDIEQFLAEARLTANLEHPNLARVYDFGKTAEGVYYFAMQYVRGCSIAAWIRDKGFLPENETLLVARSIADALDYAWQEAGVIHCDIKPANVIVDGDGTVKVVDLGVAQSINRVVKRKTIEEVVVAGTPEYMAPEQVRGEYPLDCRVDIYALGAMMSHCLTGIKPFDGHPQEDIMALQETGFIQDPRDIRPELSVAICCLVETFMAKDRKFRHADWDEVRQDIKRVRKGQLPDRLLPPDGISTVRRSPARDRRGQEMKREPSQPKVTQAPPVYDRFSPDDQVITRKTRKRMPFPKAKWVLAGFLGLAIAALIGLVLENLRTSGNSRTGNLQITASGDRSPASKPVPSPATPSISPSYVGREQAIETELKVITDKAEKPASQEHLMEAAKPQILTKDMAERTLQEDIDTVEDQSQDENKAIETKLTQLESFPAPPAVTAKPEPDITWLKNMLLEHNPKLAPEQITAQSLDGKVVRLEIVSLYVRDIGSARKLADLEALVCIAFKPDENIDSPKSAPIEDLTPLKELRLRELNLFGTNVKDLTPLQDMPLETLDIANTNVKDLTPLKKLPLKSLNIKQTAVRDLTPILNLPIEQIWLDFNPSKRSRETDRKFWDVLRRMPSLKFINDRAVAEYKEKSGRTGI